MVCTHLNGKSQFRVVFVVGVLLLLLVIPALSAKHRINKRIHWRQTEASFEAEITESQDSGLISVFEQKVKFVKPTAGKAAGSFDVDTGAYYDRVDLAELGKWDAEPGSPLLPIRPLRLLVPYNEQVIKIRVIKGPHDIVSGAYYIEPAQEPIPISQSKKTKGTAKNPQIYNSDSAYPGMPCGDVTIQKMHGYSILNLNLFPVVYYPAKRKIAYYPEISVQLETRPLDKPAQADSGGIDFVDRGYADEIRRLVENPEILDTYLSDSESPASPQSEGMALLPDMFEYVIITNNAFRDATTTSTFQDLVNTKTARGLSATIVTVEDDIYPFYTGTENGDNADKIREFIKDAYVNWGTRWVLLGGDAEIIPKRGVYVGTGSYEEFSMPTDLYYACLDGPWNNDGDSLWGEGNDGVNGSDIDLYAEVYVGRAPVSSAQELSNFVRKTIQYETQAHIHGKRAVWLGEKLDDIPTWGSSSSIAIKEQCLPGDWTVIERYDSAGGWSGANFVADLEDSPHAITHLGHANQTYNARISNSSVVGLSNSDPYFMYSQGCNSGSFDTHDICIAEQHVVSSAGAVGVVMNARYGWYAPGSYPSYSHRYALQFWDAIFNEGKISFGQANQDAREDNQYLVGTTGVYRWINFETNLFGDPETQFQLTAPPLPSGIHGTVVDDTDGNGVQDEGESGIEGEVVFLDDDGDGVLDASEQFVTTGVDGSYTFMNLMAGTYDVCHELPQNWEHTSPLSGVHEVTLAEEEVRTGINFLMVLTPPTPPNAPSDLSAYAVSHEQIDLSWIDNSDDEEWFRIERGLDGINYNQIAQVSTDITTYSDSGLDDDTEYFYQVLASNAGGDSEYSNPASATTDLLPPAVDKTAMDELYVAGTVDGSYVDTHFSDDDYESIQEVVKGHKFKGYSTLEHKWLFDVSAGAEIFFFIEAWHSASVDGDDFTFAYSTDNINYFDLITIAKTVDDDALMSVSMPANISGIVYIRVIDTDGGSYNIEKDTLYVDQMFIRSNTGQPDTTVPTPNPMTWATPPHATGSSSISMTATTAIDDSGVEYYFACISGDGHDSTWQASPTYEDTGLQANTSYTYTVKARDLSANQNETAISDPALATTEDEPTPTDYHVEAIDCGTIAGNRPKVLGRVMVTIYDDLGQPVADANVTGKFTGDFVETLSATTDSSGIAEFTTSTDFKKPKYTFTVVDVVHHILPYNPSDNVETYDSY